MSGSISRINNSTIDEARIRIYGSVTLSNGAIVRATSNFHNRGAIYRRCDKKQHYIINYDNL
jgi:hypothetical protein